MKKASEAVVKKYQRYVMDNYVRTPLVITKGKGSRVWDAEGKQYLDLFPGWGVSGLGHNHRWVMRALRGQSMRLAHVANNYYHPTQAKAAEALIKRSFDGKVFFCNSGAEAVETAIKIARKWGKGRPEIIVMERAFHGRTMGALSATQARYQEGFEPVVPGFVRVPFGDLAAVKAALTPDTVAVLAEPIQGEGGINVPDKSFLTGLRKLCDEKNLLLMFDEVQTGMGRTGEWFAFQHFGVTPDVMMLAKALGGGFPVGAVVAGPKAAAVLTPGTHATTFGGSGLASACVLAVIEAIEKEKLLARVKLLSGRAFRRLEKLKAESSIIREIRGVGFMIGIELSVDGRPIVEAARRRGLLVNCTQGTVIRMLPALTITRLELDRAITILSDVMKEHADTRQAAKQ